MTPDALVAGIDEAGRGALAGPVVAAAVILLAPLRRRRRGLPSWSPLPRSLSGILIADSKILTAHQRDVGSLWIRANAFVGVGIVSSSVIERKGIVPATELAMQKAVAELGEACVPISLLVDGRDAFTFTIPHRSIVHGDRLHPSIAAASIIAKVTRDRIMLQHHARYPVYGFQQHKGYGTAKHLQMIRTHGACPLHRRSFLHLEEELTISVAA